MPIEFSTTARIVVQGPPMASFGGVAPALASCAASTSAAITAAVDANVTHSMVATASRVNRRPGATSSSSPTARYGTTRMPPAR